MRIAGPGAASRCPGARRGGWARSLGTRRAEGGEAVQLTGLDRDITDIEAQERGHEHLARETNHWVNNSFAVIEAPPTLGSRTSTEVRSFARPTKAQTHALADAHRLAADHALHSSERMSHVAVGVLVDIELNARPQSPGDSEIALAPGAAPHAPRPGPRARRRKPASSRSS